MLTVKLLTQASPVKLAFRQKLNCVLICINKILSETPEYIWSRRCTTTCVLALKDTYCESPNLYIYVHIYNIKIYIKKNIYKKYIYKYITDVLFTLHYGSKKIALLHFLLYIFLIINISKVPST